jgi:peptide/nickel transport system permease protein
MVTIGTESESVAPAAVADTPAGPRINLTLYRYLQAFRTPKGIFAAAAIALLTAAAFLAPVIFPGGYDLQSRSALLPISGAHPFGTDEIGRDILVRSLYGLRTDLTLVYVALPITMAIGTLLGLIGFVSPLLGTAVQRVLDLIVGFPSLILGISVVLVLGPGWPALLTSICIIGLPTFGRLARSSLLSLQLREFVIAARTLGISRWTVMVRHILPNALDSIIVVGALFVVHAIFLESGLSIVGLGIQPPEPSLGTLLNSGMRYINQSPTYIVGPVLILLLLALAFSLLTDALNQTVNRA